MSVPTAVVLTCRRSIREMAPIAGFPPFGEGMPDVEIPFEEEAA